MNPGLLPSADHAQHDRWLVVRAACHDDDLTPAEAASARALMDGCNDCAALAADITTISPRDRGLARTGAAAGLPPDPGAGRRGPRRCPRSTRSLARLAPCHGPAPARRRQPRHRHRARRRGPVRSRAPCRHRHPLRMPSRPPWGCGAGRRRRRTARSWTPPTPEAPHHGHAGRATGECAREPRGPGQARARGQTGLAPDDSGRPPLRHRPPDASCFTRMAKATTRRDHRTPERRPLTPSSRMSRRSPAPRPPRVATGPGRGRGQPDPVSPTTRPRRSCCWASCWRAPACSCCC